MEFRRRQFKSAGSRVALVPGSYNPPTNAHRALLEAALGHVDEAVALLPRAFPHKSYAGEIALEQRLQMLERMSDAPYSIAISDGGLFIEMCEEFQSVAGPAEVYIVCGRDAAERILNWDYTDPSTLDRMFASFQLLVAARQGEFAVPERFRARIQALGLPAGHDAVSSTVVRDRIRRRLAWRHLVPEGVSSLVESLYK